MRILYIEDSSSLRGTVSRGFKNEGFIINVAEDGISGLDSALETEYDVIIIDVMLPGLDGFAVLDELKKAGNESQILMLTARNSVEDRVRGLESGADDYLIKPFAWKELLARVRNLVRHRYGQTSKYLSVGYLKIDTQARRIWYQSKELQLRPREFSILEYLVLRSGKIVSRTELCEHVYDHAVDLKSNAIDSAVCNIRKKLNTEGCDNIISTIPRRGYLLEAVHHKS